MNLYARYCGFCGKLLNTYDKSVDGCNRCGTRFEEIEPVEKACKAEQVTEYEEGIFVD